MSDAPSPAREAGAGRDRDDGKWKVLIVDDEEDIHQVTRLVLSNFSFDGRSLRFISAYDSEQAKEVLEENPDIAVLLLDVVMDGDDAGLRLVKHIRNVLENPYIRIILRTGQPGRAPENKVILEYDINDYKEKTELTAQKLFTTMVSAIRSYRDIMTIERNRREMEETHRELIFTLGDIIERRSLETGRHVQRVSEYARLLAVLSGFGEAEADVLAVASAVHDIGKVAIPDLVLNKPGSLSADEFELMKTHAALGAEMLRFSRRELFVAASIIAHEHHERWDGSGYPRGLAGEGIHPYARIAALADVFDALTNDRVYRGAWSVEDARSHILGEAGMHFEPKLVGLFDSRWEEFLAIRSRLD